jgi:NADPH:quinone reductase
MRAVGLYKYLPIEDPQSLIDLEIPQPDIPTDGYDLLVAIKAISVNPVDNKVRRGLIPITVQIEKNTPRLLGWDAAGEIVEAGSDCTLFKKGDAVYYAGSISRPLGTNCEFHLVDGRIVGRKPKSLSFEAAAALPLTTITAWEALYDRLSLYADVVGGKTATASHPVMPTDVPDINNKNRNEHQSYILIIGGAGGVGSIAIQLAKDLANRPSSCHIPQQRHLLHSQVSM